MDPSVYQLIIGIIGVMAVLPFLNGLKIDDPDPLKAKVSSALFFFTILVFALLVPESSRQNISFMSLSLPPVVVWLEAFVIGFLISAGYEIYEER